MDSTNAAASSPPPPLHRPPPDRGFFDTVKAKAGGAVGVIAIGAVTAPIVPIIGVIGTVAGTICILRDLVKLGKAKLDYHQQKHQMAVFNKELHTITLSDKINENKPWTLKGIKAKNLTADDSLHMISGGYGSIKDRADRNVLGGKQVNIDELTTKLLSKATQLGDAKLEVVRAEENLLDEAHLIVASALSIIPFLGIFAGAAYINEATGLLKQFFLGTYYEKDEMEAILTKASKLPKEEGKKIIDEFKKEKAKKNVKEQYSGGVELERLQEMVKEGIAEKSKCEAPGFRASTIRNGVDTPMTTKEIQDHIANISAVIEHNQNMVNTFTECLSNIENCRIEISVDRGDKKDHFINGYYFPAEGKDSQQSRERPTVVLSHGNGMTAENLFGSQEMKNYRDLGYNVLFMSAGGTPGSDLIEKSEESIWQDTKAILDHLEAREAKDGQTNKDIVWHGISLGGASAFIAAELDPTNVKLIVADRAFNKARDVSANWIKNQLPAIGSAFTPYGIIKSLADRAFPSGKEIPGVTKNGIPCKTDGLNNEKKAGATSVPLIAIQANYDDCMGGGTPVDSAYKNLRNETIPAKKFEENFALDLLRAHEGNKNHGEGQTHPFRYDGIHAGDGMWLNRASLTENMKSFRDILGAIYDAKAMVKHTEKKLEELKKKVPKPDLKDAESDKEQARSILAHFEKQFSKFADQVKSDNPDSALNFMLQVESALRKKEAPPPPPPETAG